METGDTVMIGGSEADEEHLLRLRALLHDLVRKEGRVKAADELGLDPRTVGACLDGQGMSWRVREALERVHQDGAGSAAERQRRRSDALELRVEALEKELHEGLGSVREELQALREYLPETEARPARVVDQPGCATGPAQFAGETGPLQEEASQAASSPGPTKFPKRPYPELVTREPAPDDEEVYGRAWPLVKEWRMHWETHTGVGRGLVWLETEERVRDLEVTMLEEHGLTLPPEKQPLHGLWRSTQIDWRRKTLSEVRRAVARRHLIRRIITLGLWRSRLLRRDA